MEIPEEFIELCGYINGLSQIKEYSERQWISGAVGQFNHGSDQKRRAKLVRQLLGELLHGNHDGATLQKVWYQTGAGFFVADHQELRQFFELIRDDES